MPLARDVVRQGAAEHRARLPPVELRRTDNRTGPGEMHRWWIEKRAETQAQRDETYAQGDDTADLDALNGDLDEEITRAGMRGNVLPARPARRHRSTRRRQDAPDLPRRKVDARTVGKTYTARDGTTFRPSLFVTLTCPSYATVGKDGP